MNLNKSINYNSQVKVSDTVVAYLTANITAEGGISIAKTIQNKEVFLANKKAVLAEITDFENAVLEDIK